jgi:hypothetical protein
MQKIDSQSTVQEIAIEPLRMTSPRSGARLSNSERAYIRGLLALQSGEYSEAHRQISGHLKLSDTPDPDVKILSETLALFLAIQRESAILEAAVR